VHFLSTAQTKRRPIAAPAPFVRHIHIARHAAPAAPERLLGTSVRERRIFFAANGALARHFFCFFFLYSETRF
jgi:hypothetical protein